MGKCLWADVLQDMACYIDAARPAGGAVAELTLSVRLANISVAFSAGTMTLASVSNTRTALRVREEMAYV